MNGISFEMLIQWAFIGGSIYAGIRGDLKLLNQRITHVEIAIEKANQAAKAAHVRMDKHLEKGIAE